jgi:hypothetical protein
MRDIIRDPFVGNTELPEVKRMADSLYRMRQRGADCSEALGALAVFVRKPLTTRDLSGAFGSCNAETWAKDLLVDESQIPTDLSYEEMLELVGKIYTADGDEFQTVYWVRCLRVNTGDERVSDLIFWPGEYFGDGDNQRQMSPAEILDTAIASGKRER